MGIIIPAHEFLKNYDTKFGIFKPIIYCNRDICNVDKAVSINKYLAKKLIESRPSRRAMKMETFLNQVLEKLPNDVLIRDFDVMFSPQYKIDVLSVMVNACKRKPFSVCWPGKYDNGKLFYAEDGYSDFKVYNVSDYDITCIV